MNILGIDAALATMGIATGYTAPRTIKFPPHENRMVRLAAIRDFIVAEITLTRPDVAVIEGYSMGSGMTLFLGEAGGAIRLALHDHKIPVAEVPPKTLKKFATGNGNAGKGDMQLAAHTRGGIEFRAVEENACDGWWLRIAGLMFYGGCPFSMPVAQVNALDKVQWPQLNTEAVG